VRSVREWEPASSKVVDFPLGPDLHTGKEPVVLLLVAVGGVFPVESLTVDEE